jgi:hypothetical protein
VVSAPDSCDSVVPAALAGWLRARVLRLRQSSRRTFAPSLELARLEPRARDEPALVVRTGVQRADDHALRVELLNRMLADCEPVPPEDPLDSTGGCRQALVYVRPGPPELGDSDVAWAAAARCQAGMTASHVERVLVLTRWGWLDMASGERRTWVRLRA